MDNSKHLPSSDVPALTGGSDGLGWVHSQTWGSGELHWAWPEQRCSTRVSLPGPEVRLNTFSSRQCHRYKEGEASHTRSFQGSDYAFSANTSLAKASYVVKPKVKMRGCILPLWRQRGREAVNIWNSRLVYHTFERARWFKNPVPGRPGGSFGEAPAS